MTQDVFDNLFATYRQQTLRALDESTSQLSTAPKPVWLQRLRQHIQEWQQHYSQQDQALQLIRAKYQHLREGNGSLTEIDQSRLLVEEEGECHVLTATFQVKRDIIWARHQQEQWGNRMSS